MASCIRYNIMMFNALLNKIMLYAMSRIQVLSMDYYAVLMGTIQFSLLIVFLDI
jgi:hypothetical protein